MSYATIDQINRAANIAAISGLLILVLVPILWFWIGLLAAWVALGKTHFAIRATVGMAPAALLLSMRTMDAFALYVAQHVLMVAILGVWRFGRSHSGRDSPDVDTAIQPHTFSLRDLLAIIAVLGMCFALVGSTLRLDVFQSSGLRTTFMAWSFAGAIGALVMIGIVLCWVETRPLSACMYWFAVVFGPGGPLLCWLIQKGYLKVSQATRQTATTSSAITTPGIDRPQNSWWRQSRPGRLILSTSVLLLALPALWSVGILFTRAPIPDYPALADNGYDRLMIIGQMMSRPTWSGSNPPKAELQRYVNREASQLEAAATCISAPCSARVDYFDPMSFYSHTSYLRTIGHAFEAQGNLATLQKNPALAARRHLNNVRLGQQGRRHGTLTHFRTGVDIEALGLDSIARVRSEIQPGDLEYLIDAMLELDRTSPNVEDNFAVEFAHADRHDGWMGLARNRIAHYLGASHDSPVVPYARYCERTNLAKLRLLYCDLAIRSYKAIHGDYPNDLAALTPEPLDVVPSDPFTGKPLIFRIEGDGYFLYSAGPDGEDSGGTDDDLLLHTELPSVIETDNG